MRWATRDPHGSGTWPSSREGSSLSEGAELACAACDRRYGLERAGPCGCGGIPLVRYDFPSLDPPDLPARRDLWRYGPVLPLGGDEAIALGEGGTPLRPLLPTASDGPRLLLKDEGVNPTGTFKARGMAVAVPMARRRGRRRLVVPSAGNAGVALAAYAAAAGLEALVLVPEDTPPGLLREIVGRGARCLRVRGGLAEAGAAAEAAGEAGYANLATLREPYRVEGKKTMGYEVWEGLGGVPDWIVFPTGGGTGVVGLWKAFRELAQLGWTDGRLPRLCAVQSSGCAPLAQAWAERLDDVPTVRRPETVAVGLRVPRPAGFALIRRALRESDGLALAVPEADIPRAARELGARSGTYPCYEGAAAYLGAQALLRDELVRGDATVVVFNTGTGLINPQGPAPGLPLLTGPEDLQAHL